MTTAQKLLLSLGLILVVTGGGLAGLSSVSSPAPIETAAAAGKLEWQLFHKPTLMTVGYKAYGNPKAANGRHWLGKMVLSNTGGQSIKDVQVSFRIPQYLDSWSTPDIIPEILPGQSFVLPYYPKLPKKVTEIRSKSPATLEARIDYAKSDGAGRQQRIDKRDFNLRGVNEIEYTSLAAEELLTWYDMYDNTNLLAAYVTDEDEVVKQYMAKISEATGGNNVIATGKDVEMLLRKIWAFENATGMTYLGAKGVPEKLGDVMSTVQSVRLPRNVIQHNAGLCIDLAVLMSALCSAAGATPKIVLKPGHAFSVIQAGNGDYLPIETTALGHTFEEAVAVGNQQLQELLGGGGGVPYIILDVHSLHAAGLLPPELERLPTADLNAMLEERLEKYNRRTTPAPRQTQPEPPQETAEQREARLRAEREAHEAEMERQRQMAEEREREARERMAKDFELNAKSFTDPSGLVKIRYPRNWAVDYRHIARFQKKAPWYKFAATDPRSRAGVEVYMFDYTDRAQARDAIHSAVSGTLTFGPEQFTEVDGQESFTYHITMAARRTQIQGRLYLIPVGESLAGIMCVCPAEHHETMLPLFNLIFGSAQLVPNN